MIARAAAFVGAMVLSLLPRSADGGGIDLRWDHCVSDGGAGDAVFACADPDASRDLYATFITDATFTGFTRLDFVIDIQVDAPALPDFWFLTFPGTSSTGCNGAVLNEFPRASACGHARVPWDPNQAGGDPPVEYIAPYGGNSSRARLVGSIYRNSPTTIIADRVYVGFAITFPSMQATEAGGPCVGCPTPAVLVLNQVTLVSNTGAPLILTMPGLVSNCVTVGGGGNLTCGATPAKSATWGAIKSLYR